MTYEMDIPYRAFFTTEEKPQEFQSLLRTCIDSHGSLRTAITPDHVRLEVLDQADNAGKLQLSGCWRSPDFRPDNTEGVAVRLILPFLFEITEMKLPHSQIYTLGHSYRPLANFFMRNLFMAICRNAPATYETKQVGEAVTQGVRDLQRQYFYILKSVFSEPALENRSADEAIEFILANAYLPVLDFKSPLLQRGGQILRSALPGRDTARTGRLKSQLLEARAKMLVHFGN